MVRSKKRDSEDTEMEDATNKRHVEEVPDGNNEEEVEEEAEEEEYEIEAILDAKLGSFPEGKLGFLVKWKGYDESHNSWVSEDDASNAQDLISQYWAQHGQKAINKSRPRKSDTKGKTSAAQKRRSPIAVDDDSDEEPAPPKKRGKQTKSVSDNEDERPKITSAAKRGKQASATSTSAPKKPRATEKEKDEPEQKFTSMKVWQNAASWAHLVDHIETVERTEDGELMVYFTLKGKNGQASGLCCENSRVCKEKMPQLLLDFYEQNLRWRPTDS